MKIGPVVQFLQTALPLVTDRFSDTVQIDVITATGGVATVMTNTPHNLTVGRVVTIAGAVLAVPVIELTVTNGIGTLKTSADHGMTLGFDYKTRTRKTILRVRGDSDAQLNGDFDVINIPNRFYSVQFNTELADGSYTINGAKVLNYAYNLLDGRHQIVTVPSPTTFTYSIPSVDDLETVETSTLHANVRITGAADIERAEAAYTNWETQGYVNNKYYIYVTHGSTIASKDRNILNDATAVLAYGSDYRQKLIEDFDVNVFCPVAKDALCFDTREILEDIKLHLIGTIYGIPQFPQYAESELNGYIYTFVGDSAPLLNRSRLVHSFKFETMYNIGYGDAYKFGNLVPFRNINFDTVYQNESNTQYINLDVDPDFKN